MSFSKLAATAIALLLGVTGLPISTASAATVLTGCAAKRDELTTQIQQAQDNPQRRAGLEKALDEVNAHCKDSSLDKKRNQKVIDAQVKVNEAEHTLRRAEAEHRSKKKLAKLQMKWQQAKDQLAEAEAALKD